MRVVGTILLVLCILIIAGVAGAGLYFYLDLSMLEAATVAVATAALLALFHLASSHFGMRSTVSRQLGDLSRGAADMGRQVAEMGRRVAALESKLPAAADQARAVIDPVGMQINELDTQVRKLADAVAVHQSTVDTIARSASGQPARDALSLRPKRDDAKGAAVANPTDPAPIEEVSLDIIRSAIDANRIDLYLQPIVTLPRRKVRFYEAISRLRTDTGDTVDESAFVVQAQRGGLMPRIDHLVIFRCVQIVRRLLIKNREIGVFCSLSRTTLAHAEFWQQLHDFLAANRAIASSLILEFTQSSVSEMAQTEYDRLAALAEIGFRFCLNETTSLRLEAGELAPRGFHYVKVHAPILLSRATTPHSELSAGDLSELLGRFGMDLIADAIDNENAVMELLDYDVKYGQGPLFSLPRPVRAEALQPLPNAAGGSLDGLLPSMPRAAPSNGMLAPANALLFQAENADASEHIGLSGGAVGFG